MLFHSHPFLVFFTIVFSIYWSLKHAGARKLILLLASYVFYMAWDPRFGLLLLGSTLIDYLIGLGLQARRRARERKFLIVLSIVSNLTILGFFKYFNFFQESLTQLLGFQWKHLPIILPVGISFFTFQALSYTIDVYRRRLPAERQFTEFALYIALFPHLVAGPIVRAVDFLPQLKFPKYWCWDRLHEGLLLFLFGLAKKLAVADNLALVANDVFAMPEAYSSLGCYLGTLCFAGQIYCDFSGYSDMARGLALCFGYRLMDNFNMPYVSTNPSDFWKRWNISLSSWLKNYLYIPLGGNRGSRFQTLRNLLITMTLGGLWHGANWTFVLWGVFHGFYLILYHAWRSPWSRLETFPVTRLILWLLNFHFILLGWILFRSANLDVAFTILSKLMSFDSLGSTPFSNGLFFLLLLLLICHGIGAKMGFDPLWKAWEKRTPAPIMGIVYAAAVVVVLLLAPEDLLPFIYFQF